MPSLYRLTTLGTGSADQMASLDAVEAGVITGVFWSYSGSDAAGTGSDGEFELSFSQNSSFADNDVRNVVSSCAYHFAPMTAIVATGSGNAFHEIPKIPIAQGERLYVHMKNDTGVPATLNMNCYVSVEDKRGPLQRNLRR